MTVGAAAARARLREIGAQADQAIDLAEAALALAWLDRPRVEPARYRHHLALLVREVAAAGSAADRFDRRAAALHQVAALNQVIVGKYGYDGDRLTYEDLQNANLMRVIDRRKGLPIALGILYLHAARAQGWEAHGLNFPGHFLIRLDGDGRRVILDPFNRGRICDTPALRELLKAATGLDAELEPAHYAPVGNRSILLRLQNNIKLRLIRDRCWARALEVVETMLLFAPGEPEPWREAGILSSRLGHLGRAVECLQTSLEHQPDDAARHATATLLQRLRKQLN